MASDPLSDTTHKARTYLLGLSLGGLLTAWYKVTVTDIPVSGINLVFEQSLVPFALTVGIVYFLASFAIYGIDDIINLVHTPYETRGKERTLGSINQVEAQLRTTLYKILSTHGGDGSKLKEAVENIITLNPVRQGFVDDREVLSENVRQIADSYGVEYEKIFQAMIKATDEIGRIAEYRRSGKRLGYFVYRNFRIWAFDLGLPLVVAVFALWNMWAHRLPGTI